MDRWLRIGLSALVTGTAAQYTSTSSDNNAGGLTGTANCELTRQVLCGVGSHFQRREAGCARGSPHAQPTEPLRRGRPAIVALVAANEQIGQAAKS